ncbi:MAG: hypothetical protein KF832_16730 [Caldilineaceae bacterium]|nr:hypothetical protein [Caldilineaceae bacterium]
MSTGEQETPETTKFVRRQVRADLIEATPGMGALGHWLLASPMLLFLAWGWVDLVHVMSPLAQRWLNLGIGIILFAILIVLPFGYLAHAFVAALPRLFQHAGWEIRPLEPLKPEEAYTVRYLYQARHPAPFSWRRAWLRAAQGWVYLEILTIFVGAIGMIPLYFSALEFGFGR